MPNSEQGPALKMNILLMRILYFSVIQVPMCMGILLVTVNKDEGQAKGERKATLIVQQ